MMEAVLGTSDVRRKNVGNYPRVVHKRGGPRVAIPVHGRSGDKSRSIHGERKGDSRWARCDGIGNQGLTNEGHRVLRDGDQSGREQQSDSAEHPD